MRKHVLLSAAIFAFVLFAQSAQASNCGKAEVVKGDVQVKRGSGAYSALKIGDQVCQGDEVKTAGESRTKLVMDDGNVLNVNPSSAIKIEAYVNDGGDKKKVLLNVMYGKMRATVNQKYDGKSASGEPQTFQVKTKSAVAGVRGTDFLTGFEPKANKMQVVTFEGRVEVGKPGPGGSIMGSVFVGAGQKTEAAMGQPPAPPKAVPASELKSMDAGSNTVQGDKNGRGDGIGAPRNENGDKKERKPDSEGPPPIPPPPPPQELPKPEGTPIILPPPTPPPPPPPPPTPPPVVRNLPSKVKISISIGSGSQ